jgi:hypothetical protein
MMLARIEPALECSSSSIVLVMFRPVVTLARFSVPAEICPRSELLHGTDEVLVNLLVNKVQLRKLPMVARYKQYSRLKIYMLTELAGHLHVVPVCLYAIMIRL